MKNKYNLNWNENLIYLYDILKFPNSLSLSKTLSLKVISSSVFLVLPIIFSRSSVLIKGPSLPNSWSQSLIFLLLLARTFSILTSFYLLYRLHSAKTYLIWRFRLLSSAIWLFWSNLTIFSYGNICSESTWLQAEKSLGFPCAIYTLP